MSERKSGLKQETIAIIGVGVAIVAVGGTILGTLVSSTQRLEGRIASLEVRIDRVQEETRAEMRALEATARADREALEARARADREAARADREALEARARAAREVLEARARADREAFEAAARADRALFTREILRLTGEQARLAAVVEGDEP